MKQLRPKMLLVIILALFILPLTVAYLMFTGSIPFKPEHTRNMGQLVVPPVPIDWSGAVTADGRSANQALNGFWVILYALPAECSAPCLDLATGLRQVHRASGKNHDQLKVSLLLNPTTSGMARESLPAIYTLFELISKPSPAFSGALIQAGRKSTVQHTNPAVYLVDPYGNIMMTYSGEGIPGKLNKDLTRLLTWWKPGKRA